MPIDEHKNLGLEGVGEGPGNLAAGSSNSNSHNGGGGGSEASLPEMQEVLGQLSDLLPRLKAATEKLRPE